MQAAQASVREDDGDDYAESREIIAEVLDVWLEDGGSSAAMIQAMHDTVQEIMALATTKH